MTKLFDFLFGVSKKKKLEDEDPWPVFAEGQRWHYRARPGEEHSLIIILKIEEHRGGQRAIHIRVEGLKMRVPSAQGGFMNVIEHMPFSDTALCNSVTTLVGHSALLPEFLNGYHDWKAAWFAGRGGLWTIEVKEAVKKLEKNIREKNELVK